MAFDDFDANLTPEEYYEEELYENCDTGQDDEPADIDDDLGINPYDGTYDYQNDDDWGF